MDELYQEALKRRGNLRKELEALDAFLTQYAQIQRSTLKNRELKDELPLFPASGRNRAAQKAYVATTLNAVEEMIIAAGRPLSRSELLKKLEAVGFTIDGKDKSKVLGTNIWRSKRFHNLKGAGYWPVRVAIPDQHRNRQQRPSNYGHGTQS